MMTQTFEYRHKVQFLSQNVVRTSLRGIFIIYLLLVPATIQNQPVNTGSRSLGFRSAEVPKNPDANHLSSTSNDPKALQNKLAHENTNGMVYLDKQESRIKTYINLEQYMRNLTRSIGAKAIFYCDILGQPIPQFYWYKNGQQLSENANRIRIETGLWGSSLRVEQIKKSDEGTYICVATNPSGTVNATAYLRVTEKMKSVKNPKPGLVDEALAEPSPETDGFCQEFHSNVCGKYLMGHRVYVTREYQQALIETEISKFLKLTAAQPLHHIREDCLRALMEITCYYNFPVCLPILDKNSGKGITDDTHHTGQSPFTSYQPLALCRQDCYSTMQHECSSTYKYLERSLIHDVPSMIMDCDRLPIYDPDRPNTCRSISRPVPDAIEVSQVVSVADTLDGMENPLFTQQRDDFGDEPAQIKKKLNLSLKSASTGPDLVPLFISVGVMFLVGFSLLAFCFLCRKNWDHSIRLQADGSSLFSRSRNSSGFGRLNGVPCGRGSHGHQLRGQGVGAPKELNNSTKKRKIPGMGAHLKCSKKASLLVCPDDTYTVAYSPRNNTLFTQSDSSTNLANGCTAVSNAQNSLSSGPNSQLALVNELPNVNGRGTIVTPQQTHLQNGAIATYHQYQAPNFAPPPPLPPPNSPAPPPPDSRLMCVTSATMLPNSTIFLTTPHSLSVNSSHAGVSHLLPVFGHSSGDPLDGALTPNTQGPFEVNPNTESPTAYTTLRDSNSTGCQIIRLPASPNMQNGPNTNGERPTFGGTNEEERRSGPVEFPISQLRFGKQFGQGVFGPVYKAELLPHSAYENGVSVSVIVKTLSAGCPASLQADFQREAELISELDHPNILSLYGVSRQHPPWCMIFEVSQYMDLCELMAIRRAASGMTGAEGTHSFSSPLTDAEKLHVLSQVASGMDYLSSHRFVHRDLAARNVLILNDQLYCKITDLGLARDCYAGDYYRLHPQSLMLPIRWMPLDSIIYGKFTVESDIWAYGVLNWEVWSGGMRPYSNYSDLEVLDLIQTKQLLPCPNNCLPPVYSLMASCWHEKPEQRPSFKDCFHQLSYWQCNFIFGNTLKFPSSYSVPNNSAVLLARLNMNPNNDLASTHILEHGHTETHFFANGSISGYLSHENPALFTNHDPVWFDQDQRTSFGADDHCNSESQLINHKVYQPQFSPDGCSSAENGGQATQFQLHRTMPSPLLPTSRIHVQRNIDTIDTPGLGMRLLPNTTTMYIPAADSVL
ncbi:Inactive tyrosine-protein kinase transmembrane receptor ror1 [Clonorchis sinensis]|uniref:Inactive tyrosine-protein kinase transmembrane receptor ror1 n=1 Tax=Clonorchis sinensis TaxID=79923 RepID=A0A419PYZ6_CLOSI|nr:Inactive tyrosine-protein kinase transmembrane receptor ror1 [Clonorchis sinensis]